MILLRIIQAAFLVYLAVIVFTFFKDYVRNKETDYPRRTNLINYAFGFVNYVLDALGIGSFAPLMAYYKLTKSVPDILIPGTMSIGAAIPTILEAFLFMQVIEIDAKTLVLMLLASIAGTFAGVAFSRRLPERGIKTAMGTGLLIAGLLMLGGKLGVLPIGGTAIALTGYKLVLGCIGNFILGSLIPLGIGNYAPCMCMVYLLGMNPAVTFPLMMSTGAFTLSTSSISYIREGRYHRKASLAEFSSGVAGVIIAVYVVKSLPLGALQWLVIAVVLFTAVTFFVQVVKKGQRTDVLQSEGMES